MPRVRRIDARPSDPAAMTIRNLGSGTANFRILFDGFDLLGPTGLLDLVRQRASLVAGPTSSTLATAAWELLCEVTHHDNPIVPGPWPHGPALYVGSVGSGFCDDAATVLAQLWQSLGLEARVWALDGHVVPEVLIDGHWEVYDPDLDVRYLTGGSVAGVRELSAQPDLILSPEALATNGRSAHALFNRYATHIAHAYRGARPSQIRSVDEWRPATGSGRFELAPRAEITMPVPVPVAGLAAVQTRAGVAVEDLEHEGATRLPLASVTSGTSTAPSDPAARHLLVNPVLFSGPIELVGEVAQLDVRWEEPPAERRLVASPAELRFKLVDLDERVRHFRDRHGSTPVDLHDPESRRRAVQACESDQEAADLLRAIGALLEAVDPTRVSSQVAPVPLVSLALVAEQGRSDEVIDAVIASLASMA